MRIASVARKWRLRHDRIFKNEVGVFRLNVEDRVSDLVEGIILEDEEIAAEGH